MPHTARLIFAQCSLGICTKNPTVSHRLWPTSVDHPPTTGWWVVHWCRSR